MNSKPVMCGNDELTMPDLTCCEELKCKVDSLEEDMQECCTEVKRRLDGHDDDISDLENDVTNLEDTKVDKVPGKGLSTEDYTTPEKEKLAGIEAGAEVNVQSDWLQTDTTADDYIKNKPPIDTALSDTSPNAVENRAIKQYIDEAIADIPADHFLDLNKTTFIQNFNWSSTTYPGSINPNLNGKPVLVLALTDGTSTTYSFLDMTNLIDVYTGTAPIKVTGTVISHNNSGVTAGSKGDTTNQTPNFGGSFKVTSGTVDAKGHMTAFAEHTVTLPSAPSTNYTGTAPISVNGTVISHNNSGVTASSKGDTTNQTPAFGSTFKVPSGTVDSKGHVTAFADHTVKIPNTPATTTTPGLMTAADKTKLDGLSPGTTTQLRTDQYTFNGRTVGANATYNEDVPYTPPAGWTALGIIGFNNNYFTSVGITRCRLDANYIYIGLHNFNNSARTCNVYVDVLSYRII